MGKVQKKVKTNNSAFSATHTYIKLTLVSFFLLFFYAPFPYKLWQSFWCFYVILAILNESRPLIVCTHLSIQAELNLLISPKIGVHCPNDHLNILPTFWTAKWPKAPKITIRNLENFTTGWSFLHTVSENWEISCMAMMTCLSRDFGRVCSGCQNINICFHLNFQFES